MYGMCHVRLNTSPASAMTLRKHKNTGIHTLHINCYFSWALSASSPPPGCCVRGWQPGAEGTGGPCWGCWGRPPGPEEPCSSLPCSSPLPSAGARCPAHHSCWDLGGGGSERTCKHTHTQMKLHKDACRYVNTVNSYNYQTQNSAM